MFYDKDISDEVPVSRVLDGMICSGDLDGAVSLLGKYSGKETAEIFKTSFHFDRLFQLDSFLGLDNGGRTALAGMFESAPPETSSYLMWQVMQDKDDFELDMYRPRFKQLLLGRRDGRHPYGFGSATSQAVDSELIRLCGTGSFAHAFSLEPAEFKTKAFGALGHSLFRNRMCCADVFEELPDGDRFNLMCAALNHAGEFGLRQFTLSLLDSDTLDPRYKEMWLTLSSRRRDSFERYIGKYREDAAECGSFFEFSLRQTVAADKPDPVTDPRFVAWTAISRPDWFVEMAESRPDAFLALRCSDILDYEISKAG